MVYFDTRSYRWTGAIARTLVAAFLLIVVNEPPVAGQQLATIRVSGPPIDPFKAAYYAKNSGIFRKYGLNVEITLVNSGNAAMAALAGGTVDVAFTNLLPVMQAYLRGIRFPIVAPTGWYLSERPQVQLLVKMNSPIRTARDLNGKTVASSSLKDINAAAMFAWMDQNGGDSRTLHAIELPSSAIAAALEDGRIDAGTLATPFMDQALVSGAARVLAKSFDAIGKRIEVAGYVSTPEIIDKNEDAMRRFARAMHESILYTNVHMAETADLVASYSGVDVGIVSKAMRATDPEYVEAKNIQPIIDVAVKYNILDKRFDASDLISSVALKPPR